MKFLVLTVLLGTGTKINFKMNKQYFICEYIFDEELYTDRDYMHVIDFKVNLMYAFRRGRDVQITEFNLNKYIGSNWEINNKITEVLDKKETSIINTFGTDCIEQKISYKTVFENQEMSTYGTEIRIIGEIAALYEFLPTTSHIGLLKDLYVKDEFKNIVCFEHYKLLNEKRFLMSKIIDKEIRVLDLPVEYREISNR